MTGRRTATRTVDAEVCVIGGGVMGGFAALSLAEAGADVVLVERRFPGAGASGANPGTIAVQNKHAGALPLTLESIRRWADLSDRLGADVGYERRGGFRVAQTPADVERLQRDIEVQRAAGVATELVSRAHLAREAPYLSDSIIAASYCQDDGMADSLLTLRALRNRLRQLGARILSDSEVLRLHADAASDHRVVTSVGVVRAHHVVCAAGAWTPTLLEPLGVRLPLTSEVMIASITDQAPPLLSHVLTHVRGILTLKQQAVTGKVLIGGGWNGEPGENTDVHRISAANLRRNLDLAVAVVPRLAGLHVIRAWSGVEARSPDRLLVMGPLPGLDRIFVLCSAAGGFTVSPFAGELAARWILNGNAEWPTDAYGVQRLQLTPDLVPR